MVNHNDKDYRFSSVINFPKGEIPKFYGNDGYTKEKQNTITEKMKEKNK